MDTDYSESLRGFIRMYGVKQNERQTIMILEDDEDLAEGISMSLNSIDLEFVLCRTVSYDRNI